MVPGLLHVEELPRRRASEVKNRWGDLVREVRARGGVAVTNHDKIEMVVVDIAQYREMAALLAAAKERRQASLADLAAEFDRHLALLKSPDARARADAALAARGRVKPRPKAGTSF